MSHVVTHIQRAVEILHPLEGVVELRALEVTQRYGRPGTVSGYYDDYSKLATDAARWTKHAKGVYITLQQVNPALLARSANNSKIVHSGNPTTGDTDIEALQWLYVDVDAVRTSGIMATEEERQEAFAVARHVREYLNLEGWPEPVRVDSGNGAHLLYAADLLPTDAAVAKKVLEVLAFRFNTPGATVDCSVYNPARIIRLPGTQNRKGDSTEDRPHRWARLLDAPETRTVVSRESLDVLASQLPEANHKPNRRNRDVKGDDFDVEDYMTRRGVSVVSSAPWNGGTRYILSACPWNGHTDRSGYVIRFANGALAAGCHHNSCKDYRWQDFRDALEGTELRNRQAIATSKSGAIKHKERRAQPRRIGVLVSEVEREKLRWLWRGRLALGKLTILDGDPGTGKSTLYCELAARVTTGRGWPDDEAAFPEASERMGSVVIVTCEDGIADTIRPRLEEAGADLSRCLVVPSVPTYDEERGEEVDAVPTIPEHLPEIERAVQQMNARLLIIDPLFVHLSGDVNSYRDQDVRRALAPLAQLAERQDVAVLVIRHLNKMSGGHVLYRGGGSIGIVGIVRLGMLLGRTPDDEDALVLASTKANISKKASSLALRIVSSPRDPEVGMVQWEGTSDLTAQDLVSRPSQAASTVDGASEWLRNQLSDGDRPAAEVCDEAEAAGISKGVLKRAKRKLGIVSKRAGGIGDNGRWWWSLGSEVSSEKSAKGTKGFNIEGDPLSPLSSSDGLGFPGAPRDVELF